MKNILYKKILALGVCIITTLSGCKKDFDEINENPNRPLDVPTSYLLTAAEKGLADNFNDTFWGSMVGGQLAQHWASNNYSSESRYQFRTGVTNSYWNLIYAGGNNDQGNQVGGVVDLMRIIDLCTETPDKYIAYGDPNNQIAVAKTLKVWAMQLVTDTWGSVPYSDAWKGLESTNPTYDTQEQVYNGLLADINDAISKIDVGGVGPTGDVIYGGDMTQWAKFANSLKMRVAMRIADRKSSVASAAINEAVAAGVFESNADNALFPYQTAAPNFSMIYFNRFLEGRRDYAGSNIMIDTMLAIGDPRISAYFNPAANSGEFVGEVYGLSEANAAATLVGDISQFSSKILAPDFPAILMDYAEVQFLLAEAVERGYIGGSAADFYTEGIIGSVGFWRDDWSNPADSLTDYLTTVDYAGLIGGGNSWQEVIGAQKWIALYMQGLNAWSEWRRLDFGILQRPADGELEGDNIPMRLKYPVDEQLVNADSYNNALGMQGPDLLSTKLWWDMN